MSKLTKRFVYMIIIFGLLLTALGFIVLEPIVAKTYVAREINTLELRAIEIEGKLIENKPISKYECYVTYIDGNYEYYGGHSDAVKEFLKITSIDNVPPGMRVSMKGSHDLLFHVKKIDRGYLLTYEAVFETSNFVNSLRLVSTLILISMIVLSIPFAYILGKIIGDPIIKISNITKSISKGNYKIIDSIKTGDELEDLYLDIKNMSKKLEQKYSFQQRFIANLSHDFRTPLAVIRSYAEALNDGLIDKDDIGEYSQDIISEIDRLNCMVDDLIEVSKLNNGQYQMKNEYNNIYDMVTSVTGKLSNLYNKEIEVNIHNKSCVILCDNIYITRVIYNLIDNALKFTLSNVIVRTYVRGDELYFEVEDFGHGINEDEIKHIWDSYYKSAESGGVGLGLRICSEILKIHGFKYSVNTEINRGSIFYFIVPRNKFN
ncbi:sensor histidine kinase [Clostridium sp.]|uniref:sensor histidine kinase n=1 Tax=Clostridium sp. TaxID=1506 RepID=UPI002FC6E9BD